MVAVFESRFFVCKRCFAGIRPVAGSVEMAGGEFTSVVVGDDFYTLGIAFTWRHHICAGIFQHRHQERHYITLCIQVFHGLEYTCALPFPTVELWFEIPTVTLPKRNVGAVEARWCCLSVFADNKSILFFRAIVFLRSVKSDVVERFTGAIELYLISGILRTELFQNIGFECCDTFGCKRKV